MATDVEITDPQLSIYVPVPPASVAGTCAVCHGAANARDDSYWPTCWNCRTIPAGGPRTIVPISLVHVAESQLYAAARDYKAPGVTEDARAQHALLLAATLQRFLREHRPCIRTAVGADWDTITIVPSTSGKPDPHPLETTILRAPSLRPEFTRTLRWNGGRIGHTTPNPAAFETVSDVNATSVLLIDDTFTSGARVQSAAAALSSAGANVIAAVPIGRVIDTSDARYPEKERFWRSQRAQPFHFDRCCLE